MRPGRRVRRAASCGSNHLEWRSAQVLHPLPIDVRRSPHPSLAAQRTLNRIAHLVRPTCVRKVTSPRSEFWHRAP